MSAKRPLQLFGQLLLVVFVSSAFQHYVLREREAASASGAALALLSLHPENGKLSADVQRQVDDQLRHALFKLAPSIKYSIGPRRDFASPQIVEYFDKHRGGAVLFPEPSAYNDRISSFAQYLRGNPNTYDISFVIPLFIGLYALYLIIRLVKANSLKV